MTRYDEMLVQFLNWHAEHPEAWSMFVKFTNQMISKGFQNYSVNAVFERVRWETDIGGNGVTQFKMNDRYRAFYARMFMDAYPIHRGFFRTRYQISKDKEATGLSPLTPQDYPTLLPDVTGLDMLR